MMKQDAQALLDCRDNESGRSEMPEHLLGSSLSSRLHMFEG